MAISYHVYANDGQGGAINYTSPIATVAASAATPAGSFVAGPLATPSDNRFAVRAFDDVSGVEEANTDAQVRIVVDANGRDVSTRPNPVVGLAVRRTIGDVCLVSWGYITAGQGGAPTGFVVTATPASPSAGVAIPPQQTIAYAPGLAGYGCSLGGLAPTLDWTVQVVAVGASAAIVGSPTTAVLARASGTLSPVDALVATASA